MIGQEHLTRVDLQGMAAGQKALPFARRLRGVVHLTMDCGACWSALGRDEFTCEPEGFADPLVRAVFRAGRRRLCLAHRSEHLQAARDVRLRDLGFAYLVLQEAITRSHECRSTFLSQVPAKLADELLAARAESSKVRDLQAAILCAVADFHLRVGNAASARKCLESAERHLEEGSGEAAPRLEVLVAKMRLASFEGKTGEAFERQREICRQLSAEEPVRRFEVACDALTRTMPGPRPSQRLAEWALAQLHGPSGRRLSEHPDPVYRLNGLFQQARFVAGALGAMSPLASHAATELEAVRSDVEHCGDGYSQGSFHRLLGALGRDAHSYERALELFAALGLRRPFASAFEELFALQLTHPRQAHYHYRAAKLARNAFGRKASRKMLRAASERQPAAVTSLV